MNDPFLEKLKLIKILDFEFILSKEEILANIKENTDPEKTFSGITEAWNFALPSDKYICRFEGNKFWLRDKMSSFILGSEFTRIVGVVEGNEINKISKLKARVEIRLSYLLTLPFTLFLFSLIVLIILDSEIDSNNYLTATYFALIGLGMFLGLFYYFKFLVRKKVEKFTNRIQDLVLDLNIQY